MKKLLMLMLLIATCSFASTSYYISPSGSDNNSGLSPSLAWASMHHNVNCGDTVTAAASSAYIGWVFDFNWGVVSQNSCNGNVFATLKCITFDACKVIENSTGAFTVDQSYWAVTGFEVQASSGSQDVGCFAAAPNYATPISIHHILFYNNIANGCQSGGFVSFNNGSAGVDYLAIVANIAYNAAQGSSQCFSGISVYQPVRYDSTPGTHIFIGGNFSFKNQEPATCAGGAPTDGEGIILDTLDGSQGGLNPYRAQVFVTNNITVSNGGRGIQIGNNATGVAPFANVYMHHNTSWGNNNDSNQNTNVTCGDIIIANAVNTEDYMNLAATNQATGCGSNSKYAYFVNEGNYTDHIYDSWGYSASGTNNGVASSSGFSYGPGNVFGTSPAFTNAVVPGAPNCGSATSVPNCMATLIANFTPTTLAAKVYGYHLPQTLPVIDPLFPKWLCGVGIPTGLINMGCLTGSAANGITGSHGIALRQ